MSVLNSGWSGFDRDEWPVLWTPAELERLCVVRQRWRCGLIDARPPEVRRWLFYRWAVCVKGLFSG